MSEPSETELNAWMGRLSRGEREAFDPLFRALHPRALRLARVVLSDDEARDAAQVVLTKVFARASEFEPGKPCLPWFYAVAANEIRSFRRRAATARGRASDDAALAGLPASGDPEGDLLRGELLASLERAIASLDDASAEAIRAMLDGGTRAPRPSGPAFRKRVSRAYARLRHLLGGLHGE